MDRRSRSSLSRHVGLSARMLNLVGVVMVVPSLLALGLAGCAKSPATYDDAYGADVTTDTQPAAAGSGPTVSIAEVGSTYVFEPSEIVVKAGDTVTFTNNGDIKHTVTASADQTVDFKSPTMLPGGVFTTAFPDPGTYSYFCSIHGKEKMRGQVVATA
jgi:plastocyanin